MYYDAATLTENDYIPIEYTTGAKMNVDMFQEILQKPSLEAIQEILWKPSLEAIQEILQKPSLEARTA